VDIIKKERKEVRKERWTVGRQESMIKSEV
jgi:hypothetical protein